MKFDELREKINQIKLLHPIEQMDIFIKILGEIVDSFNDFPQEIITIGNVIELINKNSVVAWCGESHKNLAHSLIEKMIQHKMSDDKILAAVIFFIRKFPELISIEFLNLLIVKFEKEKIALLPFWKCDVCGKVVGKIIKSPCGCSDNFIHYECASISCHKCKRRIPGATELKLGSKKLIAFPECCIIPYINKTSMHSFFPPFTNAIICGNVELVKKYIDENPTRAIDEIIRYKKLYQYDNGIIALKKNPYENTKMQECCDYFCAETRGYPIPHFHIIDGCLDAIFELNNFINVNNIDLEKYFN